MPYKVVRRELYKVVTNKNKIKNKRNQGKQKKTRKKSKNGRIEKHG